MLVTYAKQETVEPLKTLGKYLGLGIAGAIAVFLGLFFLALGVLRLLQTEVDAFSGGGKGSLVPYLIAIATLAVLMGILFSLFLRAKKRVMA